MERETREIKVGSHTFVAKSYATALEAHTIQQAYFKGTKMELVGEVPKISEFNPAVQFEVYQELIRQMVVSMDATTENIVERCLELRSEDFDALVTELDGLVSKKKN